MREYKYKLPFNIKRRMGYFAFAMLCFVLAMGYIAYRNYAIYNTDYPWTPLVPVLFIPVLAFFYWKNYRKYANVYVTVSIGEETISTAAPGLFEVTILKGEVKAIHELPDGSLIVAKDVKTRILVPHYMDGYMDVRQQITVWAPFTPIQSLLSFVNVYRIFPVLVFLAGLVGSLIFKTPPMLGFFAAFCVAGGLHTIYMLHKLRNTVPQVARFRWFVLFMVIITAIRAYGVYFGEDA